MKSFKIHPDIANSRGSERMKEKEEERGEGGKREEKAAPYIIPIYRRPITLAFKRFPQGASWTPSAASFASSTHVQHLRTAIFRHILSFLYSRFSAAGQCPFSEGRLPYRLSSQRFSLTAFGLTLRSARNDNKIRCTAGQSFDRAQKNLYFPSLFLTW